MSKNGGKFNNRAAKKFHNPAKVDRLSQEEIFNILNEDISTILQHITDYRNHKPGSAFPDYICNGFGNLSTPLWFYEFVNDHVKIKKNGKLKTDLSNDELESIRFILADVYKKSATNFYAQQTQEFPDRNKLISKTFIRLCPDIYKKLKKLNDGLKKSQIEDGEGINEAQLRDLTVQVYGDPVFNIRFIHKKFNDSNLSDKKKIKLLKSLYGKRYIKMVGAAMTVDSTSSDFLAMLFDVIDKKSKKKRLKFLKAYADAYKENKTRYFRINKEFKKENKKLIKALIEYDIGYKKAFKGLRSASVKDNPKKDKKSDGFNNFNRK